MSEGVIRRRYAGVSSPDSADPDIKADADDQKGDKVASPAQSCLFEWDHWAALAVITITAAVTRFWGIAHPNSVVFDEVHFGKFASYYLRRTYFFDVHPPFAKLLFAFVGWLIGYNGEFLFENIGDSYIENNVPYLTYRSVPAVLGTATVALVYLIMWESGYSVPASILAAGLVLFDNAQVGQTRLILLDATLISFMALSVLCYIKFYKLRHIPFERKWWKWLLLTGVSLSCVMSTKYVGAFTFVSIGIPVLIDLWALLDAKRPGGMLSLSEFGKHFAARAMGLIVIPFLIYLFWFQVHFAVLNKSGPGDDFMSARFQETLADNALTMNSVPIKYGDVLTIKHRDTKVYLHSHPDRYPLRYDDGRISSQGQQVTGYHHNDTNNHWEILPASDETSFDQRIKPNAHIRLRHVKTNTLLLTHDVASPHFPTNQEFTTVTLEDANGSRYNDTLFQLKIEKAKSKHKFSTMTSQFKLIHVPTRVAMWTHTKPLPDWGFNQAEINGNKNLAPNSNLWFAESIVSLTEDDPRTNREPRKPKKMFFLKKYLELQRLMFHHNNALTSSHPYASWPIQWPFLLRGVSFWTDNKTRQQIYFLGNPVGWWLGTALITVFVTIVSADQLALHRGADRLGARARARLYQSVGFFFLTWIAHYIPFFLMGRQLFLHHYLPAHLAACLLAGSLVEFISLPDAINAPYGGIRYALRRRPAGEKYVVVWIVSAVILAADVVCFFFFAPLTYGKPGLSVEEVKARKWIGYDLHFAK